MKYTWKTLEKWLKHEISMEITMDISCLSHFSGYFIG